LEGDLRKAHRVVSEQLHGASQARTDDVPRHPDRSLESPSKRERVHSRLGPHVIPFELGVEMFINVSDGVAQRVQRKSPVADPVVVAAIDREALHARADDAVQLFHAAIRSFLSLFRTVLEIGSHHVQCVLNLRQLHRRIRGCDYYCHVIVSGLFG